MFTVLSSTARPSLKHGARTGVALALLTAAAPVLSQVLPGRAEAALVRTGGGPVLRVQAEECFEVPVDASYTEVSVSAGGRRVTLHEAPRGRLAIVRVGRLEVLELAKAATGPMWAPGGARLLFHEPGRGLMAFDASTPSEPPQLVDADAVQGTATWSPDGTRIAYAKRDGLWSWVAATEESRRFLRDRTAMAMAWHPDGRTIAFVEPGLAGKGARLRSVRTSGSDLKTVAELDAREIEWSPGGRHLLVRSAGGSTVLEPKTGARHVLPRSDAGTPTWIGAHKLLVHSGGIVKAVNLGGSRRDEELGSSFGAGARVVSWACDPQPEITKDLIMPNPFAGARPARSGEVRVEGVVRDGNPLAGTFTMEVTAMVDSSGKETRYPRPIEQQVAMVNGASQTDGRSKRPFRPIDLRPDVEATLWLRGGRLDVNGPLALSEAWIEGAVFATPAIAATPAKVYGPLRVAPRLSRGGIEYDGVSRESVAVPLVFPVAGNVRWSDTFLADRAGGRRRHHGQDLMAAKMTQLVACFDGVVIVGRSRGVGGHNTIRIQGDNGWTANYYHVNNDTPGTDDGRGTDQYAFAPGLETGQRVHAGQFIGYVGDSGNAEGTAPHLHFELWDSVTRAVVNATPSLRAAQKLEAPAAKVMGPSLPLRAGEVRLDGIIEEVDPVRKVIRATLLAQTSGGKTKAVTKRTSVYVVWTEAIETQILGNSALAVGFEDIRAGLYVAWVGPAPEPGKAMKPRLGAFAPPDEQ